ncbi:MAG TPA: hypothetical protein VH136_18715 [Trebonia sp.]|jgi:hypothetical protein|nr:hypothetical protein [Trebonia sp.]
MSYPVTAQPDLEKFVVECLVPLPGVTCFAYSSAQLDLAGWLWSYMIQVDARAGRKAAARDLAESARQVMAGLTSAPPWDAGTVNYVRAEAGAFWNPDPDGGPRYTARYEVRVHPSRDAWRPATPNPRRATATPADPRKEGIRS